MAFITCSKSSGSIRNLRSVAEIASGSLLFFFVFLLTAQASLFAEEQAAVPASASSKQIPNYFAEQYFMRADQKLSFNATDVEGLIFVTTPNHARNAQYSLVTDFENTAMRSILVPGPRNSKDLRAWVKSNLKKQNYMGVEVKRLTLPDEKHLFIVGHKAFSSAAEAKTEVEQARAIVEAQGGDFEGMVKQASKLFMPPPEPEETPQSRAQFEKEEQLILKYMDHMDIGNELFGPFQGTPVGEKIMWQSFGETTWRNTNLEDEQYMQQVGFWSNRVVFKGLKAPFNTLDPYIEATISLESIGTDFKSNAVFAGGVEWRPFARNAWLHNARAWGMPLLMWIRSYRFYTEYRDRKNIKDEIVGSTNHDWRAGVGIFYEWGIDLPPITEGPPSNIPDYIRRYVWGEYFGNYYFAHTNFTSEDDFNAVIFNSSIILGIRLPGIPLPSNPLMDEFVLMPYMRYEHINNSEFNFFYENRYFVAAGMRWMPFNNYRYKDNEWLAKTKIFFEYVGVGKVHNFKQEDEVPNVVDYDLRVGVNISSKRI